MSRRIDRISAGVSGTALVALGWTLAKAGILRGGGDDDKDQRYFDRLQGHQEYSLETESGKSYTLGWAAPSSVPLFMGVELEKMYEDGQITSEEVKRLFQNMSQPMLQMSMLQGINDIFEAASYAADKDDNWIAAIAAQAATGYFTQAFSTLGGQIERTAEDRRMTTYTGKDSVLPEETQYTLGKISQKVPGWDYRQIPYIDEWGRQEESPELPYRALENFFSPGYVSQVQTSAVEEELQRLKDVTGNSGVFPSRAGKSIQIDEKTRKDLTAEEWQTYATVKGQTSLETLNSIISSPGYKSLSDEQKAEAVSKAYTYADGMGKMEASEWRPDKDSTLAKMLKSPLPPAYYILYSVTKEDLDGSGSISQAEETQALISLQGVSNEQKGEMWAMENPKTKPAQNPFTGAMADKGYSPEDALAFWTIYNGKGTKEDPYTASEKKQDISEELDISMAKARELYRLMQAALEG